MKIRIFVLMLLTTLPMMGFAQGDSDCDRACLESYVDRYMTAMEKQDVDPGLFANNVKFTENGVQLPFGDEGLWYGMSGRGTYSFYVPDTETQQVAFIGTLREGGNADSEGDKVSIALRLKVLNDRITEVEQIVIRPDGDSADAEGPASMFGDVGGSIEAMISPHEVYLEAIPEDERVSRDELIHTANYYFAGLQRNNGQGYYPFTDDCERFENGFQTTKTDCKYQFEETQRGIVSRIRDRRFVAVDHERGIVFAFVFFDHNNLNWTWQMAELFKIEKGNIRRIEAVFQRSSYGLNSGWSTYEQGISENYQNIR